MNQSATMPTSDAMKQQETDLWLPPRRMRRYQIVKAAGAALFMVIFGGWLILQWSNPTMRWITIGLIVMTGWITFSSVWADLTRSAGRQLVVRDGQIQIITPQETKRITIAQIAKAVWQEETEDELGLYLYDDKDTLLAHLDIAFLADQAEARTFLGWARKRQPMNFPVQWPQNT